jgi:ketosteroid isomerase-like protein
LTREQRHIAKLSEDWMGAIATNKAADIARYMADEWVLVTPEAGPIDKRRFLDAIASGDLVHHDMHAVGEPRLQVYGKSAVMVSRVQNQGAYQGQAFAYDEWSTDVYVKTDGKWLCVMTALTPVA